MPVYIPRQWSKSIEILNKNAIAWGILSYGKDRKPKSTSEIFPTTTPKGKRLQAIGIILLEGLALV